MDCDEKCVCVVFKLNVGCGNKFICAYIIAELQFDDYLIKKKKKIQNFAMKRVIDDSPKSTSESIYTAGMQQDKNLDNVNEIVNLDKNNTNTKNYNSKLINKSENVKVDAKNYILRNVQQKQLIDDGIYKKEVNCARTISYHKLLCSCQLSCCCMCGNFCFTDCQSCYQILCSHYSVLNGCQKTVEISNSTIHDGNKNEKVCSRGLRILPFVI